MDNISLLGLLESVKSYTVTAAPTTLAYIPDFIDPQLESNLLHEIYSAQNWQYLSNRRLQIWGGKPHPNGMIAEPIPKVRVHVSKDDNHLSAS